VTREELWERVRGCSKALLDTMLEIDQTGST
jgi:hypothetical protein